MPALTMVNRSANNRRLQLLLAAFVHLTGSVVLGAAGADRTVQFEAEEFPGRTGKVYRDDRASAKRCVLQKLSKDTGELLRLGVDLDPGTYEVTLWVEIVPLEVLHGLEVTVAAGNARNVFGAFNFDVGQGYQPVTVRCVHTGGELQVRVTASGASGFDGMRLRPGANADAASTEVQPDAGRMLADTVIPDGEFDLEEDPHVRTLGVIDYRVLCDRVDVRPVTVGSAVVQSVEVDKVHYKPGETVRAIVVLNGGSQGGSYVLKTDLVTDLDRVQPVHTDPVELKPGPNPPLTLAVDLDDAAVFGHELRCSLMSNDRVVHSQGEFFGVSRNVYRVGITADHGGHNKTVMTQDRAAASSAMEGRAHAHQASRPCAQYFRCGFSRRQDLCSRSISRPRPAPSSRSSPSDISTATAPWVRTRRDQFKLKLRMQWPMRVPPDQSATASPTRSRAASTSL